MADVIGIDERVATYIVTGKDTRTGQEVSLAVMPDGRLEVRRKDYSLAKGVRTNGTVANCPKLPPGKRSAKASIVGIGLVSAAVALYGNTTSAGTGGTLVGTFFLSGTNLDSAYGPGSGAEIAEYDYYYLITSGISGVNAAVSLDLSVGSN